MGQRLTELRRTAGFDSYRSLATELSRLGYDIASISIARIEKKGANPTWNVLNILANFFHCSVDYLMGRDDYALELNGKGSKQVKKDDDDLPLELKLLIKRYLEKEQSKKNSSY